MRRSFVVGLLACVLGFASGCGSANNFFAVPTAPTTTTTATSAPAPVIAPPAPTVVSGTAHAGQPPIVGAPIYLYAIGTSGYGGPSISVLDGSITGSSDAHGGYVLSNSVGGFSIASNAVNCGAGSEAYLLISGGSAGANPNSAIGLMAPVGPCPLSASVTSIWVNEVSTVATAYALSAYALDATHVASPGSALALTGLANAVATVGNLYDNTTGHALTATPAGNGQVPQSTINALANILASCVGTGGPTSQQCSTLFAAAAAGGGAALTDTASAAISIAHNPASGVAQLFALQSQSSATFQPALASAPTSWILPVSFAGGGLNAPAGLAVDAAGNVWAANSNASTITELSPLGVPANSNGFSGGGLNQPYSVAIDAQGNVWAVNTFGNSLTELSPTGQPLSPATGYTGGGLYYPFGIAIDAAGSVWVGNGYDHASFLSHFDSTGVPLVAAGVADGLAGEIGDVQLDGTGHVWASGLDASSLINLPTTSAPVSAVFPTGALGKIQGEAIDGAGNVWVSGAANGALGEFSNTGQVLLTISSGGGLNQNRFLTVDGAGNIWTPSYAPGGVVSEFTHAGLPVAQAGFTIAPGNSGLWAAAIDGSGNVWVSTQDANVLELVGAAAPVVTPVVEAATTNRLGVRP